MLRASSAVCSRGQGCPPIWSPERREGERRRESCTDAALTRESWRLFRIAPERAGCTPGDSRKCLCQPCAARAATDRSPGSARRLGIAVQQGRCCKQGRRRCRSQERCCKHGCCRTQRTLLFARTPLTHERCRTQGCCCKHGRFGTERSRFQNPVPPQRSQICLPLRGSL
jgi:hypothetical protein